MIDIDFLETIIFKKEEEHKIQEGDYITSEIVDLLRKGSVSDRQACFAPARGYFRYLIDVSCNDCGKIMQKEFSKTKVLDYLRGARQYRCDDCEAKKIILERKHREKIRAELESSTRKMQEQINKNTEIYIENYLDPYKSWIKGTTAKAKTNDVIKYGYSVNDEKNAEAVQNLTYEDFLQTPYWQAISLYAKYLSRFRCQLCASGENLRTHHKTYDRHGYEHIPAVIKEDLIVLCDKCHEKFHEIGE